MSALGKLHDLRGVSEALLTLLRHIKHHLCRIIRGETVFLEIVPLIVILLADGIVTHGDNLIAGAYDKKGVVEYLLGDIKEHLIIMLGCHVNNRSLPVIIVIENGLDNLKGNLHVHITKYYAVAFAITYYILALLVYMNAVGGISPSGTLKGDGSIALNVKLRLEIIQLIGQHPHTNSHISPPFSYSRNKIIAKNVRKVNDIVTLRTFEVFFSVMENYFLLISAIFIARTLRGSPKRLMNPSASWWS